MELFTPVKPLFETKIAAIPLDEDASKWGPQILQELFRQVPEASEYNPQVVMMRQDPEQGFALGVIVISGQTDSALSMAGNEQPTSKKALIPIVVRNNELCPLDLVMTQDKRMYPLNGIRLREALFRPNTFDMMTDDSGDQSLYSMFYPPGRASNTPTSGWSSGAGDNVGYVYGPGFKMSSKQAMQDSLLMRVAPTLSQHDLDALSEKVSSLGLEPQLRSNPAFLAVMSQLADFDGRLMTVADADSLIDKAASYAPIEVAQFGWDNLRGTYWMKTASRSLFAMHRDDLDRKAMLKLAGDEVTKKVDTGGTVTLAEPARDTAPLNTTVDRWEVIEKPGIYRVRNSDGQEFTGWVLPSLVDFDGTRVPMAVFTNGAVAAVQGSIVGSKVADSSMGLPEDKPEGSGLFYIATPSGIEATVPFRILGREASMDGGNLVHVVTLTGQPHVIRLVDGLKAMVPGDGEVSLPSSARFLALNKETPVALIDDAEAVKSASFAQPYIAIRHGGDIIDFSFHGLPGFEATTSKVASIDDAVFMLCVAGMEPLKAHALIKHAERTMRTEYVIGVHDVRPVASVMADVEKTASQKVADIRKLRHDLVKEASVLPDIQTVDSVLSLGFLNPENIRVYVGKLPYLDRALHTVCELTLVSRLGMSEVPEAAAARAARALDEVIQGLKGLAMRSADTSGTPSAAAS